MKQKKAIELARQAGFSMENSAAIQAAERFAQLVRNEVLAEPAVEPCDLCGDRNANPAGKADMAIYEAIADGCQMEKPVFPQLSDFKNWSLLAGRALDDCFRVIETIEPESTIEELNLSELQERVKSLVVQALTLNDVLTRKQLDKASPPPAEPAVKPCGHDGMLAALKEVAEVFGEDWRDGSTQRKLGDIARAAIGKAEGGTESPPPPAEPAVEPATVEIPELLCKTSPERIWLGMFTDDEDAEFPSDHEGICWAADDFADLNVPYIRADLVPPPPAEPAVQHLPADDTEGGAL